MMKILIEGETDLKSIIIIDNGVTRFASAWEPFKSENNYGNLYKLSIIDPKLLYTYGNAKNGHIILKNNIGFRLGKMELGVMKNYIQLNKNGEIIDYDNTHPESNGSIINFIFKSL